MRSIISEAWSSVRTPVCNFTNGLVTTTGSILTYYLSDGLPSLSHTLDLVPYGLAGAFAAASYLGCQRIERRGRIGEVAPDASGSSISVIKSGAFRAGALTGFLGFTALVSGAQLPLPTAQGNPTAVAAARPSEPAPIVRPRWPTIRPA